jgi:hypothetical protein
VGQRVVSYEIGQMKTFRGLRSQKFSPRRNVKEKIAHGDGCAVGVRSVFDVAHLPTFNQNARPGWGIFSFSCEFDPGDGSD